MENQGRVAAVMLAGGKGNRLHELTKQTCKPALPVNGESRIVDWTLRNVVLSGLTDLIVATQYQPRVLESHLATVWADRFQGRLRIRNGVACTGQPAGYAGTADAVRCNLADLRDIGAEHVLVVAADHIYSMDYGAMIRAHVDSGAEVTVAANLVRSSEACAFGVFEEDDTGRVRSFSEKPERPVELKNQPGCSLVSMGIYVFDMRWLDEALSVPGDDFGHDVLPRAYAEGRAHCYRVLTPNGAPIFWRDVGTLDSYRETCLTLQREPWTCPAPFGRLSPPDTRLSRNGTVALPGSRIDPGAQVRNAIVAPGGRIRAGDKIGVDHEEDRRWFRVTAGGTVLVTPEMLERRNNSRLARRRQDATSCRAVGRKDVQKGVRL